LLRSAFCCQVVTRCGAGRASCVRWRMRWTSVPSDHGCVAPSHPPSAVSTRSYRCASTRSCSLWGPRWELSMASRFVYSHTVAVS